MSGMKSWHLQSQGYSEMCHLPKRHELAAASAPIYIPFGPQQIQVLFVDFKAFLNLAKMYLVRLSPLHAIFNVYIYGCGGHSSCSYSHLILCRPAYSRTLDLADN